MKRDLFNRIVEYVSKEHKLQKVTSKPDFESYTFLMYSRQDAIDQLKRLREMGMEPREINSRLRDITVNAYLTVNYDYTKDKISVSEFNAGWAYAGKKEKFYPFSKSRPVVCYSDKLYVFTFRTNKPRLMTTTAHQMWSGSTVGHIMKMMTGLSFDPKISVPMRYAENAKSDWDIICNKTGVNVPKSLRIFDPAEMIMLVSVLTNPNELTSLCMHVSKHGPSKKNIWIDPQDEPNSLWSTLAAMMLGYSLHAWLVRDFLYDCHKLKRKTTLRITSMKRMADEHRKMSREIMVLGCKEIKVHEHYKEMFKTFPIEGAELIESKKRLMKESIEQDHCVATYHGYINNGTSCIISVPYKGRQWTLQVNAVKVGNNQYDYRVAQFRGFRNEGAPEELNKLVTAHFESIKIPYSKEDLEELELLF